MQSIITTLEIVELERLRYDNMTEARKSQREHIIEAEKRAIIDLMRGGIIESDARKIIQSARPSHLFLNVARLVTGQQRHQSDQAVS